MPTLRIDQLATELIGPISFDIAAGECLALMGPSGVGKSLLLRAIVDLDPSTGNVMVGARARARYAGQRVAEAALRLFLPKSGWWADRVGDHFPAKSDATELIAKLGLAGSLEWDVSRLSTGERQRLAIARALCRRPKALLLDEPTSSLDDHATGLVEDLIRECCGDGMALLLVTHDRPQAERMAKRLLRMSDGGIDRALGERAMNSYISLTHGDLLLASIFLAMNAVFSILLSLRLERQLIVSALRMVTQLFLVGLVLKTSFHAFLSVAHIVGRRRHGGVCRQGDLGASGSSSTRRVGDRARRHVHVARRHASSRCLR